LHVAFVLDRSGSMSHLTDAVISGVDEFVSELRRDPGDTRFSLTAFDTRVEHVHIAVPLAEVPSLAETGYEPGGMTALFDAVAHTVLATDERLRGQGREAEKVMVVVMTDGLENSSTDYTARTLNELIQAYDGRPNWTFVYLGAGHASLAEAQAAGADLAFERGNAMRWQAEEAGLLMALKEANVVVTALDTFRAREMVDRFCRRHLIPQIDIGMVIKTKKERLTLASGQVIASIPGFACLRCWFLDDATLNEEARERPPGYDRNPGAPGDPQVVSMNGTLASEACNCVLDMVTAFSGGRRGVKVWRYDGRTGVLEQGELPSRRADCDACAEEALGDGH